MPQILSLIYLLQLSLFTTGLLNSASFKKWNNIPCRHTCKGSFLFNTITGNHSGDEDLFKLIDREKTQEQKDEIKSYMGAGAPRPSLGPEEIVPMLMKALEMNDLPDKDAGLLSMWEFAGDTTKYVFQNNITDFMESCHQTNSEFPTSFYGAAMSGQSWNLETGITRVGGEDGWIATQLMKTVSSDGRLRRWQWELRKNKRPPCLGCWKVENIASSDRNGEFEATDRGTGWSD